MNIPLLDISRQLLTIREELDEAMAKVVNETRFILGPEVSELESEMADYCGTRHAVSCASGSDALLLSLKAAGVSKGGKVITSAYSFFATAGSICRLGATPIFMDIDPDTFNFDIDQLRKTSLDGV